MKRRRSESGIKINCSFDKCKRTIFKDQKYCFQHLKRGNDNEIQDIFFSGKCDIVIPYDIIIYIFILGKPHIRQNTSFCFNLDKTLSYLNDRLVLSKTIYKMFYPTIKWDMLWFNSSYAKRIPLKFFDIQSNQDNNDSKSLNFNKKDLSPPTSDSAKKYLSINLQIDRLDKERARLQTIIYEECVGRKSIRKRERIRDFK